MKAVVFQGPGRRVVTDVAEPTIIDAADAVVRVDAVTICGTDLHILHGDVPACRPGTILGHEAVGTVRAVGDGVRSFKPGDRVLISCITACGRCRFCREGRYGQCLGGGGWILGHRINGTQAESVRVPFADTSLHLLPDSVSNESALMLADVVPTAYEVGVLAGQVAPGDTVAVVGAGPIGLAAIMTARLFSPSQIVAIDPATTRLEAAKAFGATATVADPRAAEDLVLQLTDGLGADVAVEAVGIPPTFETCTRLVRPGGRVANVGVHGTPVTLHLEDLWIRDVTITTGLVDTVTTPALLRMVRDGQLETTSFVTHRFGFGEFDEAYDVFSRPQDSGALKVAVVRS